MTTPAFTDDKKEPESVTASGKRQSQYFAAVRNRGFLNAGLDSISKAFDEDHKEEGLVSKWEFYNPKIDGGEDLVSHRQAMGFRTVDASEVTLAQGAATNKKEGPIRRGDLILLCAPREVANLIRLQDAEAAHSDLNAPKAAFEQNVEATKVKKGDGTIEGAKPFGTIKQTGEELYKVGDRTDLEPQ